VPDEGNYTRFETFTAVKIQVQVFGAVTPSLKMGAEWTSEKYPTTALRGVTTQRTSTCIKRKLFQA